MSGTLLRRFWTKLIILAVLIVVFAWNVPQVDADHYPAWAANTAYSVGDRVTYDGVHYECIQAHTSQTGWEPPNTPALWEQLDGSEPAPTPTPTPDAPTPTPAPDEPTPTPAPGGACTAPAWDSAAVYTEGDVVSHNGHQWRAKWWTQGEEPGTTGEWGVWEDLGPCDGGEPPPEPTPTATPAPTEPTPTPAPPPPGEGDLPKRILVGYWHNFDNGSTTLKLGEVSQRYDVITVAFAEPESYGSARMAFTPYNASKAAFRSDIQYLQSLGKKVIISVGGANVSLELNTAEEREAFATSMINIIDEYGFDGMDIDLEGGSVSLDSGDTDFRNPTTPRVVNLIQASRDIANRFGSDFVLSMAPETAYVQGGISRYGGMWGAYLPLIYNLQDKLTFIHVQHYNSGPMESLDGQIYSQGTADFQVAMAEPLLAGFPVAHDGNNRFPALPQEKVAFGLPANGSAAGGGYTSPAEVHQALDYLIKGQSFGGSYTLQNPSGYPNFRGLMTWSINWDAANSYEFATNHRSYLDRLD